MEPTRHKFTILKQVVEKIPSYLVSKLARKHGCDKKSRLFTPWSHVVTMIYAHLAHSLGLNDISDTLRHHSGALATIRVATAPSRNGLSHANKVREANMAEEVFWETLSEIQKEYPGFGMGRKYCGFPARFKWIINMDCIVDVCNIATLILYWETERQFFAIVYGDARCAMEPV